MADLGGGILLASSLAAISVAALICGLFFPLIRRAPLSNGRSAAFEALLHGRTELAAASSRSIRRAREAALKSVLHPDRKSRRSALESRIAAAGLKWSHRHYFKLCLALGATVFSGATILKLSPASALALALFGAWFVPWRYLAFRAETRKRAFLNAFSSAVDMIVRGAKSGLSIIDCLAMVASDAAPPVKQEFEGLLAQLRAGVPLPTAMEKLASAMPAPEVRFFVMIMSAQSHTGGNLTEALANLSGVLRDRDRIASKIRIASAEGRISALIIGALPFLVIGATAAFAPDYISLLWADEAGRRIGIICAVWLAVGIFVLGRMARINV
jgi:tight adherence protein B